MENLPASGAWWVLVLDPVKHIYRRRHGQIKRLILGFKGDYWVMNFTILVLFTQVLLYS